MMPHEMPTYAYACTECGHQFDIFQSFSDDALTTCPQCSGKLRKQFNAVGVVFKGGGFYRNDSRASSSGDGASSASSGEGASTKSTASDSSASTATSTSTTSAPSPSTAD